MTSVPSSDTAVPVEPVSDELPLSGSVQPGFEPVRDAFVRNFAEGGEIGASVCVYHRGRVVVDLAGGWSWKRAGVPYDRSALQLVFSTTKGATAICAHLLVQRGLLDLDAPVAHYWPEFAAAGKAEITVRQLLSHRAGLPVIDRPLSMDDVLAWDPIVAALADQAPVWEPGTQHGYHALTFGWLVGEVVRRIDGRSLGTFFAEEIARPLGLEFWIGLPTRYEERVSRLRLGPMPPVDGSDPTLAQLIAEILSPDSLLLRALTLNGAFGEFMAGGGPFNEPEIHAAEIPAANAITNASSLARLYAATVGDVDGTRILSDETVRGATRIESEGRDRVLVNPSRFGAGFMLHHDEFAPLLGPGSFGHNGAGGSVGFADPDHEIGFGYVMNQMRMGLAADERPTRLIDALHDCLSRS